MVLQRVETCAHSLISCQAPLEYCVGDVSRCRWKNLRCVRVKKGKDLCVHDALKLCRWYGTPPDVHFEKVLNEPKVLDTTLEFLIGFLRGI